MNKETYRNAMSQISADKEEIMMKAKNIQAQLDAQRKEMQRTGGEMTDTVQTEEPRRNHQILLTVISMAACVAVVTGFVFLMHHLNSARRSGEESGLLSAVVTETQTGREQAEQTTTETKTTSEVLHMTETEPLTTDSRVSENPGTTMGTTADTTTQTTAKTTPETTKHTTAKTTEQTTEPEKPAKKGADPEALIQELKTGHAPDFCWDDGTEEHNYCDIWYQTYGVAFLCDDIEALKKNGIGGRAVNWSDGAWTDYGGNGYGFIAGATQDNCLVQPMTGFLGRYGDTIETFGPLGHDLEFTFAREQQMSFRVLNDYAQTGKTVYIASAGELKDTAYAGDLNDVHPGKYCDCSDVIRALAEDDSVTLLGLVTAEERGYGYMENDGNAGVIVYFKLGAEPNLNDYTWLNDYLPPRWNDVTQYAVTKANSELKFVLSFNTEQVCKIAGITKPNGKSLEDYSRFNQELDAAIRNICERLNKMPDVQVARPFMEYYA